MNVVSSQDPAETAARRSRLTEALRTLTSLHELTAPQLASLADIAELVSFPPGTEIFREGSHHDRFYVVISGLVHLDMMTARSGRHVILSVGPGELLAWSSIVGERIMTATAVAAENTECCVFDAASLQGLLDQDHELGYRWMCAVARGLSRRLLATRLQLLDIYHA